MAKHDENYEYNPIKEQINGKAAERVVWTTKALNIAVDGIKKGLPLKANPFCGKNTKLLKPELIYKRTAEELDDYMHCMKDPVYFASKCFLMTPEGLQACVLRDYQVEYLRHLQEHRFSMLLACRQAGKTLNLLTNVTLKIKKDNKNLDGLLKKCYFYIYDNNYIMIDLPMFEIIYMFDKSIINSIRYHLYKLIYIIEQCQVKKYKQLKKINQKVNDFQNIIKRIFLS